VQRATTTADGEPVLARGDSTRRLPLGRYVIQETGTVSEDGRRWALDAVSCGGLLRAFEQGRIVVRLTRERPQVACRFVNVLTPPAPLPEPEPGPGPGPPPDAQPDLVLDKRALDASVDLGGIATFQLVVRNQGTAAAEQVALADRPGRGGELLAARTSQGGCVVRGALVCRLGLLEPGARATVRVRVRVVDAQGVASIAAIGSATPDERLRNNADAARVAVRGAQARCAQAATMAC
jgi:uncharacterized repeat protein (TIGR01451 family)